MKKSRFTDSQIIAVLKQLGIKSRVRRPRKWMRADPNLAVLTLDELVAEALAKNPELKFYEAEIAAAPALDHRIIVLGDRVDRGPDSAGVVDRALAWQAARTVRVLMGNHEEMFLDSLEKPEVLRHFLRYGGKGPKLLVVPGITSPAVTWRP